jgi:hypothetical protein
MPPPNVSLRCSLLGSLLLSFTRTGDDCSSLQSSQYRTRIFAVSQNDDRCSALHCTLFCYSIEIFQKRLLRPTSWRIRCSNRPGMTRQSFNGERSFALRSSLLLAGLAQSILSIPHYLPVATMFLPRLCTHELRAFQPASSTWCSAVLQC